MNIAQAIKKMEKAQLKVEFTFNMHRSSFDNTEFLSWKLRGIEGDSYIENDGTSHELTLNSPLDEIKKLPVRLKGWYGGNFSNPSDMSTDYFPGRYGMNLKQAIDHACYERGQRRRENAQNMIIEEIKKRSVEIEKEANEIMDTPEYVMTAANLPNKHELLEEVARLASVETFTPEHVKNSSAEERKVEGLGVALSVWSGWDGFKIAKVMVSALEDANFHALNRDLEPIFRKHFGENWV